LLLLLPTPPESKVYKAHNITEYRFRNVMLWTKILLLAIENGCCNKMKIWLFNYETDVLKLLPIKAH